jgi:hypothetical protein
MAAQRQSAAAQSYGCRCVPGQSLAALFAALARESRPDGIFGKDRSIRRECRDHIPVFGERYLRRLLRAYADYYNRTCFVRHRAIRSHIACANSRRVATSIRQDLIFDRDNRVMQGTLDKMKTKHIFEIAGLAAFIILC